MKKPIDNKIICIGAGGSTKVILDIIRERNNNKIIISENGSNIDSMYFWLTGILSSFLDNAPTYLVFFNTAGGDPAQLMTTYSETLLAISLGAVFMGANTYIGNAPNFMVKSIAEENQINMPTFFGYMLWSVCILVPFLIIFSLIYF